MTSNPNELTGFHLQPSAEVALLVTKLGELIREVAKENGYSSVKTINVLERDGFCGAHEFVVPMLEILKRPSDSPLHMLSAIQIAHLYVGNEKNQKIILDVLEEQLNNGRHVIFQSGMVKLLWAVYRSSIQSKKG